MKDEQTQPKQTAATISDLIQARDWLQAISQLEAIVRVAPEDAHSLALLGYCLNSTGNLSGAVYNYRRSLNVRPDYADCLRNLADVYVRLGNADEGATPLESPGCISKSRVTPRQ